MFVKNFKCSWLLLIVCAVSFVVTGCMTATANPPKKNACVSKSNLNKMISAEASLEDFSCFIKKWKGADTLHLNVTLKNVSKEDQRYKVNIFMDNGKAVGGLLPRKTKKGLVKPGQTATFAYPVKGVTGSPGKVDLVVKTMSK